MPLMWADPRTYDWLLRPGTRWRRRMVLVGYVQFMTGFALLMTIVVSNDYDLPAAVALGWVLGFASFGKIRRARAYQRGWIDGRQAMVGSLREASAREMTFLTWLEAEQDRTLAAYGIEVVRPVPDDGP